MREPDPARCVHADAHWLYAVYFDDLRLCGCGNPEATLALILDLLRACPWYEGGWSEFANRLTMPGFEFVAHQLTAAGLIEHGTVVTGSWITEKGQRFVDLASPAFLEEENDYGYSCSDCPTVEAKEAS